MRASLYDENFVRDLLAGTLSLGHLLAAEPADVVASLLLDEPEAGDRLDEQCLDLLGHYRRTLLKCDADRFDAELLRLVSLVAVVRRVQPRKTIGSLHSGFIAWNRFFGNFVIDRGLDLRRDYWRILALTQSVGAEVAGLEPRRLMPMWLSICAGSGGRGEYPDHYLDIGMLGLRKLPLVGEISSNEDFVLHGLARWAAWQRPVKERFLLEWHLIEGDFPRTDGYWRDHAEAAMAAVENEVWERTHDTSGSAFVAAAWWRKALKGNKPAAAIKSSKGWGILEPPDPHIREALLRDVAEPLGTISDRLDQMMDAYVRHAERSGDVFYLVRTACNVGKKLLENGPNAERKARAARALGWAEIALAQEPSNVYAWALRRDALTEMGRTRDAVAIGWETIRLFPENPQWRTQLARLLGSLGDFDEARALLRETMALFPDDVVAICHAASVEADFFGDRVEARLLLERAFDLEPNDATAQRYLDRLDKGQQLVPKRPQFVSIGEANGDGALDLPAAEARRVLFRYENGLDTREQARARLADLADDPYVTFVASRIGDLGHDTIFAVVFDRSAREQSVEDLRDLRDDARPVERLLVEGALAIVEGRTVEDIPANDNLPGVLMRLRGLFELFNSSHSPSKVDKLRLLGDMSASMLSPVLAA